MAISPELPPDPRPPGASAPAPAPEPPPPSPIHPAEAAMRSEVALATLAGETLPPFFVLVRERPIRGRVQSTLRYAPEDHGIADVATGDPSALRRLAHALSALGVGESRKSLLARKTEVERLRKTFAVAEAFRSTPHNKPIPARLRKHYGTAAQVEELRKAWASADVFDAVEVPASIVAGAEEYTGLAYPFGLPREDGIMAPDSPSFYKNLAPYWIGQTDSPMDRRIRGVS